MMPRCNSKTHQQGVVLFIALIMLVAMTLAGIAVVRSVDTANIVAGNLTFRQETISAGDGALQAAFTWLGARTEADLINDGDPVTTGYYSSSAELDWFNDATWDGGVTYVDPQGNTVSYIIQRLCDTPNIPQADAQCARVTSTSAGAATGGSMRVGAPVYLSNPRLAYRITARVVGPRNTVSVVQSTVLLPTS